MRALFFALILTFSGTEMAFATWCSPFLVNGSEDIQVVNLSEDEVQKIQALVDKLGRDLIVVGSATMLKRRNAGTDLPIGKGPNTKSDIDYVFPLPADVEAASHAYFTWKYGRLFVKLPDLDLTQGFLYTPRESTNRLWFKPHRPPVFLGAGTPNLQPEPWNPRDEAIEIVAQIKKNNARMSAILNTPAANDEALENARKEQRQLAEQLNHLRSIVEKEPL